MLNRGVYPAAVTPFLPSGEIDYASVARLVAYFRAAGCSGLVVAGTNGEGPSLSAVEKRDLLRFAVSQAEGLPVILGIATNSLTEATWLASQARKAGAAAVMVMPPMFFGQASDRDVCSWFRHVADECPTILYNFPRLTGRAISAEMLTSLAEHPQVVGLKDSSGDKANIAAYRAAGPDLCLFQGYEPMLVESLDAGWTGSVSGAANVLPRWLSEVCQGWSSENRASAGAKMAVLKPLLEAVKGAQQPQAHKQVLSEWSVISHAAVRLPLAACGGSGLGAMIEQTLGIRAGELGF